MARLTPIEIDALPDYSNAQMLKLVRVMIADVVSDPDAMVSFPNGRSYTQKDIDKLVRMEKYYVRRVCAESASSSTGGAGVVQFGKPV